MDTHKIILTGVSRGLGKDLLRIILKNNPDYEVIGTART
jgi:short-subunit dehydrogenase